MKIRLALVAIAAAALTLVGCQNTQTAAPADPCKIASDMSPTYRDWIIQATQDGATGSTLTAYCQGLVDYDPAHLHA